MIRLELLREILFPTPTMRVIEEALRKILRDQGAPLKEIEEKVGMIYGNAFKKNESSGKRVIR